MLQKSCYHISHPQKTLATLFVGILFVFYCCLTAGCYNTQYLSKDQNLLDKTIVKIENAPDTTNKNTLSYNLYLLSRPKPNRKIGPLRPRLWLYDYKNQLDLFKNNIRFVGARKAVGIISRDVAGSEDTLGVSGRLLGWAKRKFGEPAVFIDSTALERSARTMHSYLFNKGYFHNQIDYEINTTDEHLSTVTYLARLNEPYNLDSIFWPTDTASAINRMLQREIPRSILKPGIPFSDEILQNEINRLVGKLRNAGYYDFSGKYITYRLDSTQSTRKVKVWVTLKPAREDSLHIAYNVRNVFIYTDYINAKDISAFNDTLIYNGYHFLYNKKLKIKPGLLTDYLFIKPGKLYAQQDHQAAISHLIELDIYKFVNVFFEKADSALLDCRIYLTPGKNMQISAEAELSNRMQIGNSASQIGFDVRGGWRNRNLLRGGESLNINLYSGFQWQTGQGVGNSLAITGETAMILPKFLSPIPIKNISRYFRPHTNLGLKAGYTRQLGFYTLYSTGLSYAFDWRENSRKRHILSLATASFLTFFDKTQSFIDFLADNPSIRSSFAEQLILGSSYSYIYSNQTANKLSNFIFFRANADVAGNSLYLLDKLWKPNDMLKIGSANYAQYARIDADLRFYQPLNKRSSFVWRLYGGIGYAYGNATQMPYPKYFSVGGPSSLRAFRLRGIGPGSYTTSEEEPGRFNRIGDLKLEANAEYRFDIWYVFRGAVFADMGNVWSMPRANPQDNLDNATFDPKKFWREIGLGIGSGVRMDFTYFVLRFDLATPVFNPSKPQGERFVLDKFNPGNSNWRQQNLLLNLAIGYPF